jgi:hypothetical protein
VAKRDRGRVTALLTADTDFERGALLAPALDADPHKLAHAVAIDRLERVAGQNLLVEVLAQELALGIVA